MKVRTDFVTNSSSSSFLLMFNDKMPPGIGVSTIEGLKRYWQQHFGESDEPGEFVFHDEFLRAAEHINNTGNAIETFTIERMDGDSFAIKLEKKFNCKVKEFNL